MKQSLLRYIHFKTFRRVAIEKLIAYDKKKHGLLVNHAMGAGKTTTALLFLANFPRYRKVVAGPLSSHAEWTEGLEKFELKKYSVIKHEDLVSEQIGPKTVVVIDEAHLLDERTIPLRKLQSCLKIMLLTGTPVKSSVSDIGFLINIAAGRDVIPRTPLEFKRTFYTVDKVRSAVFGYTGPVLVEPGLQYLKSMIIMTAMYALVGAIIVHLSVYFRERQFESVPGKKGLFEYLGTFDELYGQGFFVNLFYFLKSSTNAPTGGEDFKARYTQQQLVARPDYTARMMRFNIQKILQRLTDGEKGTYMYTEADDKEIKEGKIPIDLFGKFEGEDERKGYMWTLPIWKFAYEILGPMSKLIRAFSYLDVAVLSVLAIMALQTGYKYLKELNDIVVLDTKKLGKAIAPYIVSYNPFLQNDTVMLKQFPKVKRHVKRYYLTLDQTATLQKIMLGLLSAEEYKGLGLDYDPRISNPYEYYGRMVSNLRPSRKFKLILDMYRAKSEPTVVWSNFDQGLDEFAAAAEAQGYSTVKLTYQNKKEELKRSLDGQVDFLLLRYVEAMSLPGVLVMHVLEPPGDMVTREQLHARIIRYTYGAENTSTVNIYTWLGLLPNLAIVGAALARMWVKYGLAQAPLEFKRKVDQDASPDSIVFKRLQRTRRDYEDLYNVFLSLDRERPSHPRICVPVQPGKKATCPKLYASLN